MEYLQKTIVRKRLSLLCFVLVAFCSITFSQSYVTEEVTEFVVSPDGAGNYTYYMITAGDATLMVNGSNVTVGSQTDSTFTYFYYDGTRLIAAYNFTGGSKVDITDRVVYNTNMTSEGALKTSTSLNLSASTENWVTLYVGNNNIGFKNNPSFLGRPLPVTTTYLMYNNTNGWRTTSGLRDLLSSPSGTTLKFYKVTDLNIPTTPTTPDAKPQRNINFSHSPGQANTSLNKDGMQDVHTLEFTMYLAPGESRELAMPVGSGSAPHAYFRWYNFDTDKASNAIITNLNHTTGYVKTDWGNIIANNTTSSSPSIQGVTTFTFDGNPINIACDASNYADFATLTRDNTDTITDITEPTLSYRVIYHIHSSAEIAPQLAACTSTPFEEYNFVAPADSVVTMTTEMRSYGGASN